MSLFDRLVDEALKARPDLSTLRSVVEKELLHHDILREMSVAGLLSELTFIGGTCLRACYGSARLSEDLDFTGGSLFKRSTLSDLGRILEEKIEARYGLRVTAGAPVKEEGRVATWKLSVETRPGRRDLPSQRIHIDVCALPSHDARQMMLRNIYGVEMGTSGLILRAQSREEILADKIIALAFRENRVKNRDLWDIAWLKQQGIELPAHLIPLKIRDRQRKPAEFISLLRGRVAEVHGRPEMKRDFINEIRRFLPAAAVRETIEQPAYWQYLGQVLDEEAAKAAAACAPARKPR
jgi:predicted nucleotidyltransferase component of viral defense system